jgi:hypothetical protein
LPSIPVKFAPVGARAARHLLAVDIPVAASGGAKLLKLHVNVASRGK